MKSRARLRSDDPQTSAVVCDAPLCSLPQVVPKMPPVRHLHRLRRPGRGTFLDEDVARISPLKHANLNVPGRYSFTAGVPASGALRPLRDPDADTGTE